MDRDYLAAKCDSRNRQVATIRSHRLHDVTAPHHGSERLLFTEHLVPMIEARSVLSTPYWRDETNRIRASASFAMTWVPSQSLNGLLAFDVVCALVRARALSIYGIHLPLTADRPCSLQ